MTTDNLIYGKVPPQAKEIEGAIIGAIMLEKRAFELVSEILQPECFYVDANQRVFNAIKLLATANKPIDLLTVVEQLLSTGELELVGGPYYVTTLTNSVTSAANIEAYSHIVFQKWLGREFIRIAGNLINDAYNDTVDVFDAQSRHEKEFTTLTLSNNKKDNCVQLGEAMVKSITRIEELSKQESHITGVTTGYPILDKITHGWQKTDLIILAARPSVGKTAKALNFARNAIIQTNISVAFFSLEMSTGQLVNRIISAQSEIWLEKINNGDVSEFELKTIYKKAVQPMGSKKLFIDDTAALTSFELRAKARRLKRKNPDLGLIIIDYLQLMSGENNKGNREQEISKISRDLKGLAKELEVPIIALSQLSREPEKRSGNNKTPQLSDLRESGAIEQDADMVMFLYRPEYYGITGDDIGEDTKGLTLLSIAKHRNGSIAMNQDALKFRALLHIQKFVEWEDNNVFGSGNFHKNTDGWRPIKEAEKFTEDENF